MPFYYDDERYQVNVARIGYCLCGFAEACWAPLLPLLREELSLSTVQISALVLTLGLGAVAGMLLSSLALRWLNFKTTYAVTSFTLAAAICLLPFAPNFETVFVLLLVFGMSMGCLDVSIVIFAAEIENKFKVLLMAKLFACYSLGEVAGALIMMILLSLELSPQIAILGLISLLYLCVLWHIPHIIPLRQAPKVKQKKERIRPRQPVISLALIVAITYIACGAVLDWSGLYITQEADIPLSLASCGYALVCGFMLLLRLWSEPLIKFFGPFNCTFYGALLETVGFLGLVLYPSVWTIVPCFIAIGVGMSQISPLSTSAAGHQDKMPLVAAISLVSICGYTGLLLGPAILGAIATFFSLKQIFLFLAGLCLISALLLLGCRPAMEAITKDFHGLDENPKEDEEEEADAEEA